MLIYAEAAGVAFAETIIYQLVVPITQSGTVFRMLKLIAWGDVAAEYTIYINDVVIGGGRTSESFRTLELSYPEIDSHGLTMNAMIRAHVGDTFKITGRHCNSGSHTLKINIVTEN